MPPTPAGGWQCLRCRYRAAGRKVKKGENVPQHTRELGRALFGVPLPETKGETRPFPKLTIPDTLAAKRGDQTLVAPPSKRKSAAHRLSSRKVTRVRDWWHRIRNADEAGPLEDDIPLGQTSVEGAMTDEDIIHMLKKFLEGMGHAPREDMLRALRLGRARGGAIRLCREFDWPECPRQVRPRFTNVL